MRAPRLPAARGALCAALLCAGGGAHAAAAWCPAPRNDDDAVTISSEHMRADRAGRIALERGVQIERGTDRLRADRIDYDRRQGFVQARGNVLYTNCDVEDPDWFISAEQLTYDRDSGVGTVRNAWFYFHDVPFFYLPRYRAEPGGRRKSGVLTPDLDYGSNAGLHFELPLYLNLAPNYDFRVAPGGLSRRGALATAEGRYLDRRARAEASSRWVRDNDYGHARYANRLNYRASDDLRFAFDLDFYRVSDVDYFDDIGSALGPEDSFLRSHFEFKTAWRSWRFGLLGETFQRADSIAGDSRPYARKPMAWLEHDWFAARPNLGLHTRLECAEFVTKRDTDEGRRCDGATRLDWQLRRGNMHLKPALGLRHTRYRIDRAAGANDSVHRTVPSFSLLGGLDFSNAVAGGRFLQTFEPSLFYLYVPYRRQEHIPLFDTGLADFRMSRLFYENRYHGIDRIGDASHIGAALITRLYDARDGSQLLSAGVGQIRHLKDRKVCLDDAQLLDAGVGQSGECDRRRDSDSDFAAELEARLHEKLSLHTALVWDPDEHATSQGYSRLALNNGGRRTLNLFHRYRRRATDQVGVGAGAQLTNNWRAFGSWSHTLRRGKYLDWSAGVEYNSCCWHARLFGRRGLNDLGGDASLDRGDFDYDTYFGIEFGLRGLLESRSASAALINQEVEGFNP